MKKFSGLEHSNDLFQKEKALAATNGIFVTWTVADERKIKIFKQVAAALPGIKVREYIKETEKEEPILGAKITNLKGNNLSTFWMIKSEVPLFTSLKPTDKQIKEVVSKVIADYNSGELEKRVQLKINRLYSRLETRQDL